jgi:electron transfer flavoprotein beta subunit
LHPLRIVVCVKVTPKPEEIRVDPDTNMLNRADVRSEINPPDMNALEVALRIKDEWGGQVEIISMGPLFVEAILRVGLAMGADHLYLLSDSAFGGADTLATTYTLAKGIEKIPDVDLVICGEESSDGATGQVPSGLAEWLNLPQLTQIDQLQIFPDRRAAVGRRPAKGIVELLEVPLPALASIKVAANEPRFMDYSLKTDAFEDSKITIWTYYDLSTQEFIGLAGSPTRVSGIVQAPSRERKRTVIEGTSQQIAQQLSKIIVDSL